MGEDQNLSRLKHMPASEYTARRIADTLEQIAANEVVDPAVLDATFTAVMDGTNTSAILRSWFPRALAMQGENTDRFALLNRFGKMCGDAVGDKIFTVRNYKAEYSSVTTMTAMDDLAGLGSGQLCTEASTETPDWTDEHPIGGWWIHANAISKSDGTMNVLAIKGLDSNFDDSGELGPVYSFFCGLYEYMHDDGEYEYHSYSTHPHANFVPRPECVDPTGAFRYISWTPAYAGSLSLSGGLTSGAEKKPYISQSASTGLTKARVTSAYEGLMTDCDSKWALDMFQLRHLDLENSGIAEGCTNYDYQYAVALAEQGVKRVLLTTAQAANLVAGSTVSVGDAGESTNYDRGQAHMHNLASSVKITHIEEVEISGTTYAAVYLDIAEDIDTTATTHIITMPWITGATDALPGKKDGCFHNLTAGKGPLRIMGVELLTGHNDLGLDPLYNVTAGSDGTHWDYAVYECKDSTKQATSITSDYVDTEIEYEDMPQGWNNLKAYVKTALGILFPRLINGGAGSTTYLKSSFAGSYSAGVRCPWRRGHLNSAAYAGLACGSGHGTPSGASWSGAPRLGGAGKKRGEWTA